jgi:hypothetical protein
MRAIQPLPTLSRFALCFPRRHFLSFPFVQRQREALFSLLYYIQFQLRPIHTIFELSSTAIIVFTSSI